MAYGSNIGMIIRARRNQNNVTLTELSEKTGLSIGYLSQFERGLTSTTSDTIDKIAAALDMDINKETVENKNNSPILRSYERSLSTIEGHSIIKYNLSNMDGMENMNPRFVVLLPMEEVPDCYTHSGQEFIYVLEGILSVELEDQIYDLYPEDAAHYKSTTPHNWFNRTSKPVKFITVNLSVEPDAPGHL